MSTVLFLTDTLAIWVCFERSTAINVHIETLHIGKAPYEPCAWLKGKKASITLVVDSARSEVEAYPLKSVGSGIRDRSNGRALRRRLIERYPEAIVSVPDKTSKLDALLVQHTNLSQNHHQWLSTLEEENLVIGSVVSSIEALADMFAFASGTYIVLSNVLGNHKHTFCRGGYALFTRSFDCADSQVNDPDGLARGLSDTLAHLQATQLLDEEPCVYLIGFSAQTASHLAGLDGISGATCFEQDAECAKRAANVADENLSQYSSVIQIAKHAQARFRPRVSPSGRHVSVFLAKREERLQKKRYRVQLAALLGLCVLSVSHTGMKIRQQQLLLNQSQLKQSELHNAIQELRTELDKHSPASMALAEALKDTLALKAVIGVGPGVLLSMLGEVLSAHRTLSLEELTWVSFDDKPAAQFNMNTYQIPDGRTARESLPDEVTVRSSLLISIAGSSLLDSTLRARQDAVNALVGKLQQQAGISHLSIIDSPLLTVSSQSLADPSASSSRFRIQFRVEHNALNEA